MSEQPRKLYLDGGKSIGDIFRAHVRWLRASVEKESQAEKPYDLKPYRGMHLKIPVWDWSSRPLTYPSVEPVTGGGGGGLQSHTIIWPTPDCSLFLRTLDCQEGNDGSGSGSIWLTAPYTSGGRFQWSLWESSGGAVITVHDSPGINQSISFDVDIINEAAETIEVCGRAVYFGGLIGGSTAVGPEGMFPGWLSPEPLPEGFTGSNFYQSSVLDCGCSDSPSNCSDCTTMTWDEDTSPETMGQSAAVSIAISGGAAPFSWSVVGTGFSLDYAVTQGLTNTLRTTGVACGSGIVTITCGDGITEAEGAVRCTTGTWGDFETTKNYCTLDGCELVPGWFWQHCCNTQCCDDTCDRSIAGTCETTNNQYNYKYYWDESPCTGCICFCRIPDTGDWENIPCFNGTGYECIRTFHSRRLWEC